MLKAFANKFVLHKFKIFKSYVTYNGKSWIQVKLSLDMNQIFAQF